MFCRKCGREVEDNWEICPYCEEDLESCVKIVENQKVVRREYQSDMVKAYEQQIWEKLLVKFIHGEEINAKEFYAKAKFYEVSEENVNEFVDEFLEKIKKLNLFIKDEFVENVKFDLNEEDELEIIRYATVLGFEEDEVEEIITRYIETNHIEKKKEIYMKYISQYMDTGEIIFKEGEEESNDIYIYLKESIEIIENLLKELYKKSEDYELSENQIELIYSKGEQLFPREVIVGILHGYEKKKGILEYKEKKKQEKTIEKLSTEIGKYSTVVQGIELNYEGDYFLKEKIKDYFIWKSNEIKKVNQDIDQKNEFELKKVVYKLVNFQEESYKIICYVESLLGEISFDMAGKKVDEYIYQMQLAVEAAYQKLQEIDSSEELKKLERELRKSMRGKWQGGGFGVGSAIKGAVTAGAMNIATGAAHSIVNSIGNIGSNVSATIQRKQIFDLFSNLTEGMLQLWKEIENDILVNIKRDMPWVIYEVDTLQQKKLEGEYRKIKNGKGIQIAIQILQENPYDLENYMRVVNDLNNVITKDDILKLVQLATKFNINFIDSLKEELYSANRKENYVELEKMEKICLMADSIFTEIELGTYVDEILSLISECGNIEEPKIYQTILFNLKTLDEKYPRLKLLHKYENYVDTDIESLKMLLTEMYQPSIQIKMKKLELEKDVVNQKQKEEIEESITEGEKFCKTVKDYISDYEVGRKGRSQLTIGENGKIYDSVEKANEIREKIKDIPLIYDECDLENYQDVRKTLDCIQLIYSETSIGKIIVEELAYRCEKLEIAEKTVNGIEYSSIEEAQQKKQELKERTVDGVCYDTLEEADRVRLEKLMLSEAGYWENRGSLDFRLENNINFLKNAYKINLKTNYVKDKREKYYLSLVEDFNTAIKKHKEDGIVTGRIFSLFASLITIFITIISIFVLLPLFPIGTIIAIVLLLGSWGFCSALRSERKSYKQKGKVLAVFKKKISDVANLRENCNQSNEEEYIYCKKCNKKILRTAKFCRFCGSKNN